MSLELLSGICYYRDATGIATGGICYCSDAVGIAKWNMLLFKI